MEIAGEGDGELGSRALDRGKQEPTVGKELRNELESRPAKRRGENGPSAQHWGTSGRAQGSLVCAQVCGNWQLDPRIS